MSFTQQVSVTPKENCFGYLLLPPRITHRGQESRWGWVLWPDSGPSPGLKVGLGEDYCQLILMELKWR